MKSQRRESTAFLGLVIWCAFVASTCKRSPPPSATARDETPALGPVVLKSVPAADFRGDKIRIDEEKLRTKVKGLLEQSGVFAGADAQRAAVVVTIELIPAAEGSAEAVEMVVSLRLKATLRPEGRAPLHYTEDVAAMGRAPLETQDVPEARAAFQRLAERSAEDLVQTYLARQKLWSADARQVAEALKSADNDQRIEALRVVGERQLRDLADLAIGLLEDEDEDVRDAALGALVVLRERGAVKVLARSRQMRDVREMRKVLDAMATLGGREAHDYLAFVAENHDEEEIRAMAKAALERMTHREQPKSTK
jgi:hypothetical protein